MIKLLIIDILKPLQTSLLDFGKQIVDADESYSVNLRVVEKDEKTENVEMIVTGDDIDFELLKSKIEASGASIHSLDEMSMGKRLLNSKDFIAIK